MQQQEPDAYSEHSVDISMTNGVKFPLLSLRQCFERYMKVGVDDVEIMLTFDPSDGRSVLTVSSAAK